MFYIKNNIEIYKLEDNEIAVCYNLSNGKKSFQTENALAILLLEEVLFTNSMWWEKDLPDWAKKRTGLFVNCNDIFAWGCADSEDIDYEEIETLFRMWEKDPEWGPAIWCIIKRKEMPQKPVEEKIRKAGIWDLDTLNLEENTTDLWVKYQIAKFAQERNKK